MASLRGATLQRFAAAPRPVGDRLASVGGQRAAQSALCTLQAADQSLQRRH